jgi:shikimate dehydrogenase
MKKSFGLIGYPLSHSFSQKYFNEKFKNEKLNNYEYQLFELENCDSLENVLIENTTLLGLNVTIPHKEKIIPFLSSIDETASHIGAVNCIKISSSNNKRILKGFNTDAFGFRQSIKPFLESNHNRALILGTGGASKAVHFVLKQIGIDCYFVTRDKSNKQSSNYFLYSELNNYVMDAFKLIVNTTPVGMYPTIENYPEIPYQYLTDKHLIYDLIYNPIETMFLSKGKAQGAKTVNGLSMLHLQAEEAWRIWNDVNL